MELTEMGGKNRGTPENGCPKQRKKSFENAAKTAAFAVGASITALVPAGCTIDDVDIIQPPPSERRESDGDADADSDVGPVTDAGPDAADADVADAEADSETDSEGECNRSHECDPLLDGQRQVRRNMEIGDILETLEVDFVCEGYRFEDDEIFAQFLVQDKCGEPLTDEEGEERRVWINSRNSESFTHTNDLGVEAEYEIFVVADEIDATLGTISAGAAVSCVETETGPTDGDADTDVDVDADSDSDGDAEPDADEDMIVSDGDADADLDADEELDADPDVETDAEADADVDEDFDSGGSPAACVGVVDTAGPVWAMLFVGIDEPVGGYKFRYVGFEMEETAPDVFEPIGILVEMRCDDGTLIFADPLAVSFGDARSVTTEEGTVLIEDTGASTDTAAPVNITVSLP